jgi:hypothetical protein
MATWISKQEAMALLNVSERTLARYRRIEWEVGIEYAKPIQKTSYNKELIEDWLVNRGDPMAHLRAVQAYQASLPSNQRRRRSA